MSRAKKTTSRHVPVVVEQDEDEVCIVSVKALRGCRSYGRTIDEAMQNIAEAVALCLEDEQPAPARTGYSNRVARHHPIERWLGWTRGNPP